MHNTLINIHNYHLTSFKFSVEPIVSEKCYICQYSMATVIASPCTHQRLCAPCHETYIKIPPYNNLPYYRCPLCRGEITKYFIIVKDLKTIIILITNFPSWKLF